jgi:hypothetical protein
MSADSPCLKSIPSLWRSCGRINHRFPLTFALKSYLCRWNPTEMIYINQLLIGWELLHIYTGLAYFILISCVWRKTWFFLGLVVENVISSNKETIVLLEFDIMVKGFYRILLMMIYVVVLGKIWSLYGNYYYYCDTFDFHFLVLLIYCVQNIFFGIMRYFVMM